MSYIKLSIPLVVKIVPLIGSQFHITIGKMRSLQFLCFLFSFGTAMATPFRKRGSCVPPDVNQATIDLMLDYQKCKPNPYNNDGAHTWTVGCGHKCAKPKCTELPYPIPLSDVGHNLPPKSPSRSTNCSLRQTWRRSSRRTSR